MALLLSSGSPQRQEILRQLGVPFRSWVPELDELVDGEPARLALRNSHLKAQAGRAHAAPDELVVGVDTIVVLDDSVYGKPTNESHARQMLARLRCREHIVISGLTLCVDGIPHGVSASTSVCFRAFDDRTLDGYLASGEWEGRAGGYAIQGSGAALVEAIRGDYYNVVGFPVACFLDLVDELNLRHRVYANGIATA